MDFKKRLAELYKLNADTTEFIESMLTRASEIEVDKPTEARTLRDQMATLEMLRKDAFGRHIDLIEAHVEAQEELAKIEREQVALRMNAKTCRKYGDDLRAWHMELAANKLVRARTCAALREAETRIALHEGGVLK